MIRQLLVTRMDRALAVLIEHHSRCKVVRRDEERRAPKYANIALWCSSHDCMPISRLARTKVLSL